MLDILQSEVFIMVYIDLLNSSNVRVARLSQEECNANIRRVINGEWSINIMYPVNPQNDKMQYFNLRRVRARVVDAESIVYQTFLLSKPQLQKSGNGSIVLTVDGVHYSQMQMKTEVITGVHDFSGEQASVILARIFSFSSVYTLGTCPTTAPVSLKLSWETVLSGFQKVIDATKLEYDIDESTNTINFYSALGSTTKYIHIREGKNLKSIKMVSYNDNVINKIYGIGGGDHPVSIAGARHRIQSVLGQVVSVDHNKLLSENDALNALRIKIESGVLAGSFFTITDCSKGISYDSVTVSGTISSLSAGDTISICKSDNSYVNYIEAPSSVSSYGMLTDVYKNSKYSDTINLVKTSTLDGVYSAGLCQDFTLSGSPTVSRNTNNDYIKYGSASQRVQCTVDGQGIYQATSLVLNQYYIVKIFCYVASGSVRVRFAMGSSTWESAIVSSGTGWQMLSINFLASTTSITISILQNGATATEFYLDAMQVSPTIPTTDGAGYEDRKFVKGSEQLDLWFETYDRLMTTKLPRVEYTANFVDLNRISPSDYPFEKIDLGDTVLITDENIGANEVPARITQLNYNIFKPELTEHAITTSAT
jgi:hypothetical protein